MYDGTLQEVELSCRESMMKQLVDHFGTNFEVLPAEEGQFIAKVKVSVSRTFFSWLFQFGSDVRIKGPEQVGGAVPPDAGGYAPGLRMRN